MRIRAILVIFFLLSAGRSLAEGPPKANPMVTSTQYMGARPLNQMVYQLSPEGDSEFSSKYNLSGNSCSELLTEQNSAGLAKTKLSEDLRQYYVELAKKVQGVTFLETIDDSVALEGEAAEEYQYQILSDNHINFTEMKLRTAIAWVVPSVFPFAENPLDNPLPWQMESVFKEEQEAILKMQLNTVAIPPIALLSQGHLERSMDFEFGRLNQFVSGHGRWIYPTLGLNALTQAIAVGADPLKSHVYLHSASPVNTRLYKSRLQKDPILNKEDGGVQHALFKIPLVDYMQAFPPSAVSNLLGGLKGLLPQLQEWQLALIAKQYYDLSEFYTESKTATANLDIRVRLWSKKYKQRALKLFLDSYSIIEADQAKVFDYFASQNNAPVSSDHINSLTMHKDFSMQFQLTEGQKVQLDVPEALSAMHLQNPEVLVEFMSQSLLFLLRLPADRHQSGLDLDTGKRILLSNKDFLLKNDIEVIFSTDDTEILKTFLAVGGEALPVTSERLASKYYIRFSAARLFDIFVLHMQRGLRPSIGEFGFFGKQTQFQYTQRRMAY